MNEYQEALDYFAEHMILNLTYEYDEDSEEFKDHQTEDPACRGNNYNSVFGTDQAGERRDSAVDRRPDRRIRT